MVFTLNFNSDLVDRVTLSLNRFYISGAFLCLTC